MNTNLLKEAIAEADAIKKMAIENAKASLNEAFDSKIKSMLAARLEEEADDLEEEYEEEDEAALFEKKKGAEEDEDENEGPAHEKGEEMKDPGHEEKEKKSGKEDEDDTDEGFDLEEILAELEKGDGKEDEMEEGSYEEEDEAAEVYEGDDEKQPEEPVEDEEDGDSDGGDGEEGGVDEEINIEALLAELGHEEEDEVEEAKEEDDEENEDESYSLEEEMLSLLEKMKAKRQGKGAFGNKKAHSKESEESEDDITKKDTAFKKKVSSREDELQEIKRQAAELAQKVNETNLINAKLLYLNKILRKYNLSEQQKVKVISAFDKANTVKESKIVHESLDQAFSVKNDNVKTGLKESIGFASSAAGTSTKRVINEGVVSDVDKQVSRWQKLAGIIK